MGEVASGEATRRSASARDRALALEPAGIAWLAAVPCAVLVVLAVLLLAPPLSRLLFPAQHVVFLPGDPQRLTPEPLESTRYLLMLAGPVLLGGVVAATSRRRPALSPRWTTIGVAVAQGLLAVTVVVCLVEQRRPIWGNDYFNAVTLAVAAAMTTAIAIILRRAAARTHARRLLRDTRGRRIALLAAAAALTAIWLLPAVNSEASISWAFLDYDTQFPYDETFAVLNGLTPLADFNTQYAALIPYAIALAMRAFEPTLLVFTITACALSLLALLAVYDILRRAARNATLAFGLYVPFMATSMFFIGGIPLMRFTPGTYFPMFPLRYGGAYLLAWLLARHVERGRRAVWPLLVVAGLVLINNFEFGVAAFIATIGALLTTVPLRRQPLLRLAGAVAAGAGLAGALYSLFALVRSGALPDFLRLAQFARFYGVAGYSVAPIPGVLGLPLLIFGTHAAAIVTAIVLKREREPNRVLTAMLMWAGLFGPGAAAYYVARSNSAMLPMTFSAWSLSLALLAIVVLQRAAATVPRIPRPPSIAVIFGVGLMACSLAQVPTPWAEIERVRERPPSVELRPARWEPPSQEPVVRRFVSALADGPRRFRIADAYDIVDVVPYTGPRSIHTTEQLDESLDALAAAGGNTALVPIEYYEQLHADLSRRRFALVTHRGLRVLPADASELPADAVVIDEFTKWVDMRHPHASALG
jgi:hypothetical protein